MTDTPVAPPPNDRIEPVGLEVEMTRSYIDYAMSVIVGRALPDVRDGLKPVHRRVLYSMYDQGYRPDRGYVKCARVVGDVMGNYHPHGDSSIYDALVRLAQPWSLRYPLIDGNGNFGSPGNDPAAAMRYTESRLMPLAMEMLREIDEDTVDFTPNYDGRSQEPYPLPSRIPNLLVNGAAGIAVGMATNIPPHNLTEISNAVQWCLANPEATPEELLEACISRVSGPDFPTYGQIVGRSGIDEAYRTGRGSVRMRAKVMIEEDRKGRTILVITELPYQVNPDNLAEAIADLVRDGRLTGIANIQDESSGRTGQRLVIVLKRDAVAKVVLNNLYKHTQLQYTFGVNMLAIVDGVPRTLTLGQMVSYYVAHQVEVIVRRTRFRLRKAQERAHILSGLLKAIDRIDEVIALIRGSESAEAARAGLIALLEIDEEQATAILDMQLRRLAALEASRLQQEFDELMQAIAGYNAILESPSRQREIVGEELAAVVAKYGDERRTEIVAAEGDLSEMDLIAQEDVVVTVTRGGYAKRTKVDLYRAQKRGGKGVRGANLREDDIVEHVFVTSTHHWLLFFTNLGRVYRCKAFELPDLDRNAKGQHVANVLAFLPDERIAQVIPARDYEVASYLVLATRSGKIKKTELKKYDSPRTGGLIAINLNEGDEVIDAELIDDDSELLLVSSGAKALRFKTNPSELRPLGRDTAGVQGMVLPEGQRLIAMELATPGATLAVMTDEGFVKRTRVEDYPITHRNTQGVKTFSSDGDRGILVGALIVAPGDEIFAIRSDGVIIRTRVTHTDPRVTGRDTKGVKLMDLPPGESVVAVARGGDFSDAEADLEGEPGQDTDVTPRSGAEAISSEGSSDDQASE